MTHRSSAAEFSWDSLRSAHATAAATRAEHYGHPATTPYAIADWWCKYLLPPGGVLLDPFCGSGMMLAAALDN